MPGKLEMRIAHLLEVVPHLSHHGVKGFRGTDGGIGGTIVYIEQQSRYIPVGLRRNVCVNVQYDVKRTDEASRNYSCGRFAGTQGRCLLPAIKQPTPQATPPCSPGQLFRRKRRTLWPVKTNKQYRRFYLVSFSWVSRFVEHVYFLFENVYYKFCSLLISQPAPLLRPPVDFPSRPQIS